MDVEYLFPWGWGELESIAHRGTYDLDAHMRLSGKDLHLLRRGNEGELHPDLIESSAGMDRTTLTMLVDAFDREKTVDANGKEPSVPSCASIRRSRRSGQRSSRWHATSPELVERAGRSSATFDVRIRTQYDEGNIGQLYRRQDEIGTPFCVTVDYETLGDATVTVRERDSMSQERVGDEVLKPISRNAFSAARSRCPCQLRSTTVMLQGESVTLNVVDSVPSFVSTGPSQTLFFEASYRRLS